MQFTIQKSASLLITLLCASTCTARSILGQRTLIVVDDEIKASYGKFIGDLQSRGFSVSILSPKSTSLTLFEHDERKYDHVILFPSKSKGLGPNLQSPSFLRHSSKGGNVLVFLDSSRDSTVPAAINELAGQLDITLLPRGVKIVDHFSGSNEHDKLLVPLPTFPDNFKNYFISGGNKKVAFKGQALVLGESPLIQPILKAPRTAFAYDSDDTAEYADDDNIAGAGTQLALVAAVQARNNARITFVGGTDLVADAAISDTTLANKAFIKDLTAWTFQETGVIKVESVHHWGEEFGPKVVNGSVYRIKHDVTYQIALSEYSYDHWIPYTAPSSDAVQLEFRMLDPYYRLDLHAQTTSSKTATVYKRTFRTPDQHGIFTFSVNYKRPFLTYIHEKDAVTLRHFAHNEWTRSWGISASWVWIAGIWVVVGGWVGFVALWLFSAPMEANRVTKKTQ